MVEVIVPATSANMGAGFDTMGIALAKYNTIRVEEIEKGLWIVNENKEYIPKNENNLIFRAINRVFEKTGYEKKGIKITQNSDIPMTRGLGSSSACIIGGLLAANIISGRKLSYQELLEIAVDIEGHPDNVVPALFGGFCVSVRDNGKTYYKSIKLPPSLKYAVMTPDFIVATRKSRKILPEKVPLKDAVHNISRASWLSVCLATGDFDNLRLGVEDLIHQPYRKGYIEDMEKIFDTTYKNGAKATFLSGSGPTILSIIDKNISDSFKSAMTEVFETGENKWTVDVVGIDNVGAIVKNVKSN